MRNKGLIIEDIRNRGNLDLSKRSSCFVHQGTKVGSAEEYNQHILIPQRVSQQVSALSPSEAIVSNLRKWGILPQISTFPSSNTHILDKHPRQSWPKDCSPAVYQTFKGTTSPVIQKLPQESPIQFPRKVGIHLPKQ